jgi:allantoate deiminase
MFADAARDVVRRCRLLANHSEEPGFTTRAFLCDSMCLVHADLSSWMTSLGMQVHVDPAGNLRGTLRGTASDAPRLFIGSHLDTVPRAGAFDGVLGVVMGVALIEALGGRRLPFSVEVVGFSEEEGVRFGLPFIGSRAFVGTVDDALLSRKDAHGITVEKAIRRYGLDPSRMSEARAGSNALGYLEFHIEQGPVLDALGLPLGIVDVISGQTRADVTFLGGSGHAGTTPMDARRDALAAAAEWIALVEQDARRTAGIVATVGRIEARPGAANVIAGWCRATLDVRHPDDNVRVAAAARLRALAEEVAARRGLAVEWAPGVEQSATAMSASLIAKLTRAIERAGAPVKMLPSGAGHDAMIVAPHMPTAMLFLRSPGGISHHEDEVVMEADVEVALAAGVNFLDEIARTVGA